MGNVSDSSRTAIASASSMSPEIQEGRYWHENDKSSTSVARNILFYDDISQDADLEHELFYWKRNSNSYSVEKKGCVSRHDVAQTCASMRNNSFLSQPNDDRIVRVLASVPEPAVLKPAEGMDVRNSSVRESEKSMFIRGRKSVSFTDIFGDKTIQQNDDTTKSISFENMDFDDELFFPSDVGKEMLQKDEENHSREFMCKNNASCTPCSLWTVRSARRLPDHSPLEDVDYNQSNRRRLRKYSESTDTFSDDPFRQRLNFGHDASTPITNRRVTFNFSQMEERVSKLNIQDPNENETSLEVAPLYPMLLYSAKKANHPEDYSYHIGERNRKNIQRLRAEEKMKANFVGDFAICSNSSSNSAEMTTGVLRGSGSSFGLDKTPMKYSLTKTNLENPQQKDSLMEQWTVQPQELTLDVGNKGGRILLINNSKKDLKFQTRYDSKKTNINPLSGNLPAKGQIGLRILASRFLNGRLKEDTEDIIMITCGKVEKTVCVKIRKEKKSNISRKDRSFICY